MKTIPCYLGKSFFIFSLTYSLVSALPLPILAQPSQEGNKYVGVDGCVDCHEEIVDIYRKTSGKAHSDKSVLKMRKKLTESEFQTCLSCHTTGYGEPTGFVSFEKTPHLAEVGCESCHGMGYIHTQEQTAESIDLKPTLEVCERCHDDASVPRIHYDGRVHAGGH